jgi:tetratricopeptide (TPR) repeat protein
MSLLKKLFGAGDAPAIRASPDAAAPPKPAGADLVKVFDQFGRPVQIPREQWRTQVLLPNLASKRGDPNALYDLIANALRDGFAAEVLEPARHLAGTDPQRARSANLLGVILLQLGRFAEAKAVLEQALTADGGGAYLLANLAKACAGLGDTARRDDLLWRALERDPNQSAAVLWYAALAKEQAGAEGEAKAFERIAALPGSWLAKLWVARAALAAKDTGRALSLYGEVLAEVQPPPAEALMQISGDLGNAGQLDRLIELCAPRFDPALHGIQVGNNLIKANLDLGRTDEARRLIEQLYGQRRPDWRDILRDWERRLQEAERREQPVDAPISLGFMAIEQPLWALGTLGFDALLPRKDAQALRMTFICGTAETPGPKDTQVRMQHTDALGQVTRTIPLYLAEEIHLRTSAATRTLVPVVQPDNLALVGAPWTLAALDKACEGSDIVVLLHVDARSAPWQLNFSAHLWATKAAIGQWAIPLTLQSPAPAIQAALDRLLAELRGLPRLGMQPADSLFHWALGDHAALYAGALEQALIVALVSSSQSEKPAIWGERGMLDRLLEVAVSTPANARFRLLLLNTIQREGRRRPDIVREYLERLTLLQQRHPLPAGAAAELAAAALEKIRDAVKPN